MGGGSGSTKSTTVTTPKPLEGMEEIPKYIGGWMYNKDTGGGVIPEIFNNTIPYLKTQVWDQPIENRLAGFAPEEKAAQGYVTGSFGNMADSLWNVNNAVTGWGLGQVPRANEAFSDAYSQFNDWSNALRGSAEYPYQLGRANMADTISGKYTQAGSNPYLADYMQMASRPTLEALDRSMAQNASSAELAGRETGGLRQALNAESTDQATRALNELNTGIAMGAYLPERQMQQQAGQQAIGQMNQMLGFDQAKTNMAGDMLNKAMGYMFQVPEAQGSAMDQWYQNIGALSSVGEQNRMMDQTKMDMRRQMAFEPYSDIVNYFLDPMIGLTTGQMGSATTQQIQQPSGLNQGLGAGSQLAGLAAALKYALG